MIDTFLFDLDGTLADSVPLILACSKLTHQELNIPWDEVRMKNLIGVPLLETGEILAGKGNGKTFFDAYQRHYTVMHDTMCKSFPGIETMLQDLYNQGASLAVVTSRRRWGTERSLEYMNFAQYFKTSVCAEDCKTHKPDPEPAFLALSAMGKAPKNAVFIGDTFYDVRCAQNAGCFSAAVTWGAGERDQLVTEAPDFLADNVHALHQWLLKHLHDAGA